VARENGLADHDGNIVTHESPLRSLGGYLEPHEDFDVLTADLQNAGFHAGETVCHRDGGVLSGDLSSSPEPIDE
jgi:hypothetical protein